MNGQKKFSTLSLLVLLILNFLIGGGLYFFGVQALGRLQNWVNQPLGEGPENVTVTVQNIISYLNDFIPQSRDQLLFAAIGLALLATLVGWFLITRFAKRNFVSPSSPSAKKSKPAEMDPHSPSAALQILSIFQRDGRLLDFLHEDLSAYDDAQIGAAVHNVHEGCKKALDSCFQLKPVLGQQEGSDVNVPEGFDARQIRLVGNVVGEPPFNGALRHRGWKVTRIDLPRQTREQSENKIIAAAEVEVR